MLLRSLALAWIAGSALAALGMPIWVAALVLVFAVPFRASMPRMALVALVLAAVAVTGFKRYEKGQPAAGPGDVSRFIDKGPVRVRGVVEGDRDERERALMLRVDVSSVEDEDGVHAVGGVLLLRLPLSLNYRDGDLVEARGKIGQPGTASTFDYRGYLARQGVFAEMDYPATRLTRTGAGPGWRHELVMLRVRLADGIASVLPEPEASLGAGIALGTRRVIEPSLNRDLTDTGTAQIIVASGYNITVVASLTLAALAWLVGRRWAALLTLLAILAYTAFVGLYPSVVRAAIMGAIVVFAGLAGRPHSGMRALIIASAGMIAVSPLAVKDLSFLLSVFGTAGLFWLAEPFAGGMGGLIGLADRRGGARTLESGAVTAAATTLAAMAGSTPVILASFHTLSLSAVPANLVLFPFVPAIMAASAATAIAGTVWHPAAVILGPVAYVLLAGMVFVVRLCARMPGSQVAIGWFGGWQAAAVLGLMALVAWLRGRWGNEVGGFTAQTVRTRLRVASAALGTILPGGPPLTSPPAPLRIQRKASTVVAMGAGVAVTIGLGTLIWTAVAFPGALAGLGGGGTAAANVTYLDVGQGSAILVRSGRQRVLIDGGPPGESMVRALDRVLPPWQRSLNAIVLMERSPGHIGGLPAVMRSYHVGAVIDASDEGDDSGDSGPTWTNWQDALASTRVMELPPAPYTALELESGMLTIEPAPVKNPRGANPAATVVAQLGGHRLLLAGDAAASLEAEVRTINRGNASAPRSPARILVVEPTQVGPQASKPPAILPPTSGALVYRTTESGDISIEARDDGLRVMVGRGPRAGLGGNR